jgi:hypothetical protein
MVRGKPVQGIHPSFILPSRIAPVRKNGDSSLRLCVDSRGLNEGTIKNWYPLPLLEETLM